MGKQMVEVLSGCFVPANVYNLKKWMKDPFVSNSY